MATATGIDILLCAFDQSWTTALSTQDAAKAGKEVGTRGGGCGVFFPLPKTLAHSGAGA
jgi:hypothetical protein